MEEVTFELAVQLALLMMKKFELEKKARKTMLCLWRRVCGRCGCKDLDCLLEEVDTEIEQLRQQVGLVQHGMKISSL